MATHLPDALAAIDAAIAPLPIEDVPIEEAAGRTAAEPFCAPFALPPFASSAMDGYIVRAADTAAATRERPVRLALQLESRAGTPADAALGAGEAARISTGAMPPDGGDAVVRVEEAEIEAGELLIRAALEPGTDVRPAGTDVHAGDEVIAAGTPLDAGAIAALASLGQPTIRCRRRPAVAVVGTGDELIPVGEPLGPGQIHDSSSAMLIALAREAGADIASVTRAVPDDRTATIDALGAALEGADLLVISGGVSMGAHDHVRPALEALGARQIFWHLALRPGHPAWFGTVDTTPVLGLPGNPGSSYVIFQLLGRRALAALTGTTRRPLTITARYRGPVQHKRERLLQVLRVRLTSGAPGELPVAEPAGRHQASHALSSLIDVDGLAILGEAVRSVEDDDLVTVLLT